MTLMHIAAALQPRMIGVLVELGGNVNDVSEDGTTPLMLACDKNSFDSCGPLIRYGAAIDYQDLDGNTALMRAAILEKLTYLLLFRACYNRFLALHYTSPFPGKMGPF
jgi:ankyrin repeat protein